MRGSAPPVLPKFELRKLALQRASSHPHVDEGSLQMRVFQAVQQVYLTKSTGSPSSCRQMLAASVYLCAFRLKIMSSDHSVDKLKGPAKHLLKSLQGPQKRPFHSSLHSRLHILFCAIHDPVSTVHATVQSTLYHTVNSTSQPSTFHSMLH